MEQRWSGSVRCGLADLSKAVVQHIRVNEEALEITLQSVGGDVEETKERILSLRTETIRCEIDCRAVPSDAAADEASVGCSQPERRVRLAEATQGSMATWGRVQADPLTMSRCSTILRLDVLIKSTLKKNRNQTVCNAPCHSTTIKKNRSARRECRQFLQIRRSSITCDSGASTICSVTRAP